MKVKFLFDLDGTITKDETLPLIAKHFDVSEEIDELTRYTINGNIPFIESFIRRVDLLKNHSVQEISNLLSKCALNAEILEFISGNLKDCVVVTGNFSGWVSDLCRNIGCEFFCSEGVVQDDKVFKLTKILKKEDVVAHFQSLGYTVVFIGDGNNDATAMQLADISIASGIVHQPARSVLEVTDYLVYSEYSLVVLLNDIKNPPRDGETIVLTCAGTGSRLGLSMTKALIKIQDQSLISLQLNQLSGFSDIRVVIGYQASDVIKEALAVNKNVIFVYNHDYFHTLTGASFYLGARHGKFLSIAWDGDLLVHPKDIPSVFGCNEEFIGSSKIVSDEPVFVNLDSDMMVRSFSRSKGDYEWVGPAGIYRDKVVYNKENVYNIFEEHLPIKCLFIESRDIDTYDDYLRAIDFVCDWESSC